MKPTMKMILTIWAHSKCGVCKEFFAIERNVEDGTPDKLFCPWCGEQQTVVEEVAVVKDDTNVYIHGPAER